LQFTQDVLIEHESSLERPLMHILMLMDRDSEDHVTHIRYQSFEGYPILLDNIIFSEVKVNIKGLGQSGNRQ